MSGNGVGKRWKHFVEFVQKLRQRFAGIILDIFRELHDVGQPDRRLHLRCDALFFGESDLAKINRQPANFVCERNDLECERARIRFREFPPPGYSARVDARSDLCDFYRTLITLRFVASPQP